MIKTQPQGSSFSTVLALGFAVSGTLPSFTGPSVGLALWCSDTKHDVVTVKRQDSEPPSIFDRYETMDMARSAKHCKAGRAADT